jgi:hypothetical protein
MYPTEPQIIQGKFREETKNLLGKSHVRRNEETKKN